MPLETAKLLPEERSKLKRYVIFTIAGAWELLQCTLQNCGNIATSVGLSTDYMHTSKKNFLP
jgi:hypothetical protein